MAIKAVIFDMVSVLLVPIKGTYESLLAERLGIDEKITADIVNDPQHKRWDLDEISDDEYYTHLLNNLNLPIELKSELERFEIEDFYIDPILLEFIHYLHNNYKTALLTNFPAHLHTHMKTKWTTGGVFDHIIASCDVKLLKPDPRMYQLALSDLDCKPAEAIFIDDREVNTKAAEALGISSVLYQNRDEGIKEIKQKLAIL
jgi:putative hydrolase of the HAD superfamily